MIDNSGDQQIIFQTDSDPHAITVTYSNVQGAENAILTNDNGTITWGDGNIDTDPKLCEPEIGNFHLAENSPSAGSGEEGYNMGALDIGCEAIWVYPVVSLIADTTVDEDSEIDLILSAYSTDGYGIYFEAESDTSSVYTYIDQDTLRITLMEEWSGTTKISVLAYNEYEYSVNDTT